GIDLGAMVVKEALDENDQGGGAGAEDQPDHRATQFEKRRQHRSFYRVEQRKFKVQNTAMSQIPVTPTTGRVPTRLRQEVERVLITRAQLARRVRDLSIELER